jgi:hypothetical protein
MHRALSLAKKRAARRRDGVGAVMFVVSMTLAVLASRGLYALTAAKTELTTSGYERQNAQTHYLAEYGVLGAAQEITATKAQYYVGLMFSNAEPQCVSLPGIVNGTDTILNKPADPMLAACRRIGSQELYSKGNGGQGWQKQVLDPYTGTVSFQNGVNPGSLGPVMEQGDFFVELTEPTQAPPPPGYGLNLNFRFVLLTVSASGITQPMIANNDTARFGGEGLESERARFVAGPIQWP